MKLTTCLTLTFKKSLTGKYLALRNLLTKEKGSVINFRPCLLKIAKLKQWISLSQTSFGINRPNISLIQIDRIRNSGDMK